MNTKTSGTEERIGERTRKAATESMTVIALEDASEYKVYSGVKNAYIVDVIRDTCECPGEEYNHPADGCKHRQRVEMELGERLIANLGRRTDVEIMSGRERESGETRVATDGGTVVETAAESEAETDERPDDCDCIGELDDDGLGCWPCYRAGFTTANPDAEADDGDDEVTG